MSPDALLFALFTAGPKLLLVTDSGEQRGEKAVKLQIEESKVNVVSSILMIELLFWSLKFLLVLRGPSILVLLALLLVNLLFLADVMDLADEILIAFTLKLTVLKFKDRHMVCFSTHFLFLIIAPPTAHVLAFPPQFSSHDSKIVSFDRVEFIVLFPVKDPTVSDVNVVFRVLPRVPLPFALCVHFFS